MKKTLGGNKSKGKILQSQEGRKNHRENISILDLE
jgi:hypothetical protein